MRESEESVHTALNQNSNGVSAGVPGPAIVSEPPLSPPSPRASAQVPAAPQPERPVLEVAPPPAAVAPAEPPAAPVAPAQPDVPAGLPLEGLLLRFGLITTDQLTEAMRERSATGKDIATIVVERGWVDETQLARVGSYGPAFEPSTAAAPEPEPAVEPEPEPAVEPEPAASAPAPAPAPDPPVQPAGQRVKVFVRLTSGDRVDAGTFDGLDAAKDRGAEIARALAGDAPEWPFVAGRFLRPETIASVDVEPDLSA
jgi:hypothetical protein